MSDLLREVLGVAEGMDQVVLVPDDECRCSDRAPLLDLGHDGTDEDPMQHRRDRFRFHRDRAEDAVDQIDPGSRHAPTQGGHATEESSPR